MIAGNGLASLMIHVMNCFDVLAKSSPTTTTTRNQQTSARNPPSSSSPHSFPTNHPRFIPGPNHQNPPLHSPGKPAADHRICSSERLSNTNLHRCAALQAHIYWLVW